MSAKKINVKLLIDKRTRKVLFAEAGKDFVDFLFSLLTMPVGSVVELLRKQSMVGCIADLYESVKNISDMYMQSGQDKSTLLQPKTSFPSTCTNILMLDNSTAPTLKYYRCSHRCPHTTTVSGSRCPSCGDIMTNGETLVVSATGPTLEYYRCRSGSHNYITTVYGSICPSCQYQMHNVVTLVAPATATPAANQGDEKGGYVKDVVTYMITDDLVVSPMSTISGLTLLNKLAIKDISALEEKVVAAGMDEGLKLLKASLESRTALTDAFLGRQRCYMAGDKA